MAPCSNLECTLLIYFGAKMMMAANQFGDLCHLSSNLMHNLSKPKTGRTLLSFAAAFVPHTYVTHALYQRKEKLESIEIQAASL